MKKIVFFLFVFILIGIESNAAPAYAFRVRFKDKVGSLTFNDSLQFLSPTALQRRTKQGIQLDSSDLPLVKNYIDAVVLAGNVVKVHNKSKWFNQIVVITYDSSKVNDIIALPMVLSAELVGYYPSGNFKTANENIAKYENEISSIQAKTTRGTAAYYGDAFQQISMIKGDCIHDLGYKGEGMNIAVFDSGFRGSLTCSFFDSMFLNARMKSQYDFARDTAAAFAQTIISQHGINVLSTMASDKESVFVGTAPKANYFIYVTEDTRFEMPIEEDNWLSAAEYADSIGVDIINSSVGYNEFNTSFPSYTYNDLNGHKTLIAKAANKAVAKGIFVVVAQGNEGISAWQHMLTPADADSVYSVGSIDILGNWTISGLGPNSLGLVKPDGVALGKATTILNDACIVSQSNGSSFAAPILTGAIACLWQSLPQLNAWELRQLVKMSSNRYNSPTDTLGYGIPNLCLARDIALGVSEIQQVGYSFAIYPNPTNGVFRLKSFEPGVQVFSYKLFDITGKLIFSSKKLQSNDVLIEALKNQTAGQYLLMIEANNKSYSTQISKN